MQTNVYIDALNLYYGSLRHTAWKWLDVAMAIEASIGSLKKVHQIKYFTARVDGASDPNAPKRQDVYLRAIKSHDARINIVEGQFKRRQKQSQKLTLAF